MVLSHELLVMCGVPWVFGTQNSLCSLLLGVVGLPGIDEDEGGLHETRVLRRWVVPWGPANP